MTKDLSEKIMSKPLFAKNWEEDIRNVRIETCPHIEDPLGYKAVFYLGIESARAEKSKFFSIGASFLAQRAHNLVKRTVFAKGNLVAHCELFLKRPVGRHPVIVPTGKVTDFRVQCAPHRNIHLLIATTNA